MLVAINPHNPDSQLLQQAAQIVHQGGIVIYPTETFYGMAVDYQTPQAIEHLLQLKGRGSQQTLPLILSQCQDIEMLALSSAINNQIIELTKSYWPGPLTLILAALPDLHPALCSPPLQPDGEPGVAMRISPHSVANGLASCVDHPITSTSANLTGHPPSARADDIDPLLLNSVDLILDAGPCPGRLPSTIIDTRQKLPFKIIRQGAIKLPTVLAI
jgi:L-threonylcarbamoyladenylate synthase